MKNVTIKTIAELTNLSLTTVSRVLNGTAEKYRISKSTQKMVLKAAENLDYTPNQAAVNLRLKRSFSRGLVIPSLANPFFANVASIVSKSLREKGFSVILVECDEKVEVEVEAIGLLRSHNIEGVILIPSTKESNHLKILLNQNIPVVCIDRYYEDIAVSYVATDHYIGAFNITELLIKAGHKEIACLQGCENVISNNLRVKGYKDAMHKYNLKNTQVWGNSFTTENGYIETKLLLQRSQKVSAIFALSDTILLGALKAIEEEALRIPEDLSVVTSDNSPYLDFLSTPITSVSQPVNDISNIAIKLLMDKIDAKQKGEQVELEKVLLKPSLINRDSVMNLR